MNKQREYRVRKERFLETKRYHMEKLRDEKFLKAKERFTMPAYGKKGAK